MNCHTKFRILGYSLNANCAQLGNKRKLLVLKYSFIVQLFFTNKNLRQNPRTTEIWLRQKKNHILCDTMYDFGKHIPARNQLIRPYLPDFFWFTIELFIQIKILSKTSGSTSKMFCYFDKINEVILQLP